MRKTTSQIQEEWLEDTEYGTLAPTEEVFDETEFQEKLKTYNDAQSIKDMSETVGWLILKRELVDEAIRREQSLIHCADDNEEKLKNVKKAQQKAAHARDYIISFVEEAKSVPRPIRGNKS